MKATESSRRPRAAGVLTRAVLRAAGALGLSQRALAAILGVSEATVSRIAAGGRHVDPDTKEGELALLFLRLYRSLDALVGGDDRLAREWLHADNVHLGGAPAERIRSITGLLHAAEYLDALRGKS